MKNKYSAITEKDLATQIEDLLNIYGWMWCHFRPARTEKGWRTAISGHQGFPDYIAVKPPRLIFAELKSEKGKVSDAQQEWLDTLRDCQHTITFDPSKVRGATPALSSLAGLPLIAQPEVYLWRPDDLEEITEILS